MFKSRLALLAVAVLVSPVTLNAADPLTMSGVLESADASDWRHPAQHDLLYLRLQDGVVVFELANDFAPRHIANLRELVRSQYFDGLAIVRSQDNYVVQWGDPDSGTDTARSLGDAAATLAPEFFRDRDGLRFTAVDSDDAYAPEVGFADGFPMASDGERAWLAHCYGMLGVGRANEADSGNSAELYVVIGHAPRHLDRNVTLIGRAINGLDLLSTLPRGDGAMGFYESAGDREPIVSMRFGDQLPANEQLEFDVLRTDTETFRNLVEARRNRMEDWFVDPGGRVGLCNVPLPVRHSQ